MRVWLALLITLLLIAATAPQPAAADLSFDLASVKAADERGPIDLRVSPGGRLTVTNVRLGQLIREAYGLRRYQLQSGPAWIESEGFDIDAKPVEGQ